MTNAIGTSKVVKMTNYPSDRKSPVKLTDDEMYAVYKYCIENRAIEQIQFAISYRVDKAKIANEINMLNYFKERKINAYHIAKSVETVVSWQERLNKPVLVQESAEIEQLKIYKTKTMREVEEYRLTTDSLTNKNIELHKEIERLKKSDAQGKVDRIRAIVSA